jgi:hypothetical protein
VETLDNTTAPRLGAAELLFVTTAAADPPEQILTVVNDGFGPLSWRASADQPWLSVVPDSGSVASGRADPVEVRVSASGLPPGAHVGTVTVTGLHGSASTTVTVQVAAPRDPPVVSLDAEALSFATLQGQSPGARVVTVSNAGGGMLRWSAEATQPWLRVTPGSGTLEAGEAEAFAVSPDVAGLPAGEYTALVLVSDPEASNTSLPVTLRVSSPTAPPRIGLATSTVAFQTSAGTTSSAVETVQVLNEGGGTLAGLAVGSVTYGSGASGWLSASLQGAAVRLSLSGLVAGLAKGRYAATVPVSSQNAANAQVTLAVVLDVGPTTGASPALGLSATSVSFTAAQGGGVPAARAVTILNAGGGTLTGLSLGQVSYAGGAGGWLRASLSATAAPATLELGAEPFGLAPGTYTASVPVSATSAAGGSVPVTAILTVTAGAGASLILSSGTVSFSAAQGGADPSPQSVTLSNGGSGSLSGLAVGTVSYGTGASGWVTATLSATTAPAVLTLAARAQGLGAGTYTAVVPVEGAASNAPQSVSLTLTVSSGAQAPRISLSAASVGFAGTQGALSPTPQAVTVTNGGGGQLTGLSLGDVTYSGGTVGWLSAGLGSTTAPSTLTLAPTVGSLAPGTYTASVPVRATSAANTPQLLSVTLTVSSGVPAAALTLSRASVAFSGGQGGAAPQPATISVGSSGSAVSGLAVGSITYSGSRSGWLTAGLSGTGTPATLTLTPSTAGLPSGTYAAQVPVTGSAANSPQTVAVTLTVSPSSGGAPRIALATSSVSFTAAAGGAKPPDQVIGVANSGGGTLSGLAVGTITYVGGSSGWLAGSLSATTAPAELALSAVSAALAPGTYTASVPVTAVGAANSPQVVSVTLTVGPAATSSPKISLSSGSMTFSANAGGPNPAAQEIQVTNGGGGTLSVLAVGTIGYGGGASGWLSATVTPTTAPATLRVTANVAGLAEGSYTASVPVQSAVASNGPQTLQVTLNVSRAGAGGVPAVPLGLLATSGGSASIVLDWIDASSNESEFRIERGQGGTGAFAEVGRAGINARSWVDAGLAGGTTYFYRIRACNANGCSAYSSPAAATTTGGV